MLSTRKQRLRTLENQIRKNAEAIQKNGLEIGRDLIEIRDDELWSEDYESWNQYLKEMAEDLVGKSFSQAKTLIDAAVISTKLPKQHLTSNLTASSVAELRRLAPQSTKSSNPNEKDYSKIRKPDVARVLKKAVEIAGRETPSVRDIRKAVDHDLGVDRSAKSKETKERNNSGIELSHYLKSKAGQIEAITEHLAAVPADGWKLLEESEPGLAERLAEACDELAGLLRS